MNAEVVPYNPGWGREFEEEESRLLHAFGAVAIRFHHIGSTSVPGLVAKPIIDILGEVTSLSLADAAQKRIEALGYEALGAYGIEGRRYFRKIGRSGRRTHHLHMFVEGSAHIVRHLAFRDYLAAHPAVAAEYSKLKLHLVQRGASWDGYLDGKSLFVRKTEIAALKWYALRSRPG